MRLFELLDSRAALVKPPDLLDSFVVPAIVLCFDCLSLATAAERGEAQAEAWRLATCLSTTCLQMPGTGRGECSVTSAKADGKDVTAAILVLKRLAHLAVGIVGLDGSVAYDLRFAGQ